MDADRDGVAGPLPEQIVWAIGSLFSMPTLVSLSVSIVLWVSGLTMRAGDVASQQTGNVAPQHPGLALFSEKSVHVSGRGVRPLGERGMVGSAESRPEATRRATNRPRSLAKAQRRQLLDQWRTLFRCDPPRGIPSCWLRMAVAYRLQERAHGALRPSLQRQLLEHGPATGKPSNPATTKVGPGTVLVREWQGVTHTVTVLDKGVSYDGMLYRSLTAAADAITGAHWSGPEFFGLKAKRGAVRNDKTGR